MAAARRAGQAEGRSVRGVQNDETEDSKGRVNAAPCPGATRRNKMRHVNGRRTAPDTARRGYSLLAAAAAMVLIACFCLALGVLRTHARVPDDLAVSTAGDADALIAVGIFSSYSKEGAQRRNAIMTTWLPSPAQSASMRLSFRFVFGDAPDDPDNAIRDVKASVAPHAVLHLAGVLDVYANLPSKSAGFFAAAPELFPKAQWFLKIDDDVFLRPAMLPRVTARWSATRAAFVGCLKSGRIQTNSSYRWFEPRSKLFGGAEYPVHPWGSIYALHQTPVRAIAALERSGSQLRRFSNEDVSVGVWALALNVNFLDDRRLCVNTCTPEAVAVWDMPQCTGLCKPAAQMRSLAATPACSFLPEDEPEELPSYFTFQELNGMNDDDFGTHV